MTELTQANWEQISEAFPAEQHEEVAQLLIHECGNNLPFKANADAQDLERIRTAVLIISQGDLARLRKAVETAKRDWRDVLMVFHVKPKQ